jgi:hypothetical protein
MVIIASTAIENTLPIIQQKSVLFVAHSMPKAMISMPVLKQSDDFQTLF